jgi:AraC-like DNA-binding protein
MPIEKCLELRDWWLHPAGEWSPRPIGWTMLRVASGLGYLQSPDGVLELNPGDSACLAGESPAGIRASQLGQMRIQSFTVSTDLLAGLLTPAERCYLDGEARRGRSALRYFPAAHGVAQEFALVAEARDSTNALVFRCRLLQVFAGIFARELAGQSRPTPKTVVAVERFRQIISEIPEAGLRDCSLADLARSCGCSKRHVSRLFRNFFGVSVSQKQRDLRLEKAKLLLQESDAKVIHVALESGYQHLSLFNAMFKKHFGVTPSEWRRQHPRETNHHQRGAQVVPFRAGHAAGKPFNSTLAKANLPLENHLAGVGQPVKTENASC